MWCHASGMPVCDVMVAVKAKVVWRGGGSVHTQFQVPHGTLPARCSRPPISTSTTQAQLGLVRDKVGGRRKLNFFFVRFHKDGYF